MNRLQNAISALHEVDAEAGRRGAESKIHPAARLFVCVLFIVLTVSFQRYDLWGLLAMSLYIIITGIWEDISFRRGFGRLRVIFLFLLFLGIANPFLDREVITHLGGLEITGGMISMATLLIKGILAVYGAYFLLMTTGIDGICLALRTFRVPAGGVTVILLIYRYILLLLKEVQRMWQAYHMRAPKQRGIHISVWGSFAGLLLLRSMDRANDVYHSMLLRGYDGASLSGFLQERDHFRKGRSIVYAAGWTAALFSLRMFPVFEAVGSLF